MAPRRAARVGREDGQSAVAGARIPPRVHGGQRSAHLRERRYLLDVHGVHAAARRARESLCLGARALQQARLRERLTVTFVHGRPP
eukprot:1154809-Prymnesium_polylepis.2